MGLRIMSDKEADGGRGGLKAYRLHGPGGLISKQRGRPSNRRKPETLRTEALRIITELYPDFGPTLACAPFRNPNAA